MSGISSVNTTQAQAYYGENYDQAITDVNNGTIPEGLEPEEVIAYLLTNVDYGWMDPDTMSDVWGDDQDVIDMMSDFYGTNQSNADLELLLSDIEEFLGATNPQAQSTITDVLDVLKEYASSSQQGSTRTSQIQQNLMNLLQVLSKVSPDIYLLMHHIELSQRTGELRESLMDARRTAVEELEELQEDIVDLSGDDPQDPMVAQDLKEAQLAMENLQNMLKQIDETIKTTQEFELQAIETASDIRSRRARTQQTIINN